MDELPEDIKVELFGFYQKILVLSETAKQQLADIAKYGESYK